MVPYLVMFDLQGRRGSGGQQGLAGTPGAAVRIETKKIEDSGTQLTYSTKSSHSRAKWDILKAIKIAI